MNERDWTALHRGESGARRPGSNRRHNLAAAVAAAAAANDDDDDDDDAVVMTSFTTFWRVICDNFVREKTFYLLSCDFLLFSVYIFSYRSTTKLHLYAFMNHPSNHKSLVKS